MFSATPAVFNFDASAVVDGEDAAAAVQVRWDFEDDGTWDTAYSTTRTVAKDYAQGLALATSNETATTYLYSGNSVNGYAQSFIATSTGIGKAALIPRRTADTTAGGTCTVGIQSALSTTFLTSITVNPNISPRFVIV